MISIVLSQYKVDRYVISITFYQVHTRYISRMTPGYLSSNDKNHIKTLRWNDLLIIICCEAMIKGRRS